MRRRSTKQVTENRYNRMEHKHKIRLTKQFTFEAAHALEGYDGKCKHIHGHSYSLFVTVIGYPCTTIGNPKLGMVMDFGDLKRVVQTQIIDRFDHSLALNKGAKLTMELQAQYGRIEVLAFQPTCENMLIYFAALIQAQLTSPTTLHSLKLHETATSYAEWFASDLE